ncbi:poly(A) RNA polymerase gld-2 homolog A-like [Ctenocephalides felis]|nr:poly(A) RNA polymerase gld-2 homolog A-like [Ctenocephalides felis]
MVIHYLQCGVKPPILPCLHAMYPGKFENYTDIHTIDIHERLEPYKTDNNQSLGELLLGFFDYYANFDYSAWAISIRLAKLLKIDDCKNEQMPKNDPTQWLYICIEEPFDRTNTARSVYLYNMFLYIKSVFSFSYMKLKQTHDLDRIMDLGLPVPELQSSSLPVKNIPSGKTETKKSKYKNGCCLSNENSDQKIELSACECILKLMIE